MNRLSLCTLQEAIALRQAEDTAPEDFRRCCSDHLRLAAEELGEAAEIVRQLDRWLVTEEAAAEPLAIIFARVATALSQTAIALRVDLGGSIVKHFNAVSELHGSTMRLSEDYFYRDATLQGAAPEWARPTRQVQR